MVSHLLPVDLFLINRKVSVEAYSEAERNEFPICNVCLGVSVVHPNKGSFLVLPSYQIKIIFSF